MVQSCLAADTTVTPVTTTAAPRVGAALITTAGAAEQPRMRSAAAEVPGSGWSHQPNDTRCGVPERRLREVPQSDRAAELLQCLCHDLEQQGLDPGGGVAG